MSWPMCILCHGRNQPAKCDQCADEFCEKCLTECGYCDRCICPACSMESPAGKVVCRMHEDSDTWFRERDDEDESAAADDAFQMAYEEGA